MLQDIKGSISRATLPFKIGLLVLGAVLILHIVGLSTPKWSCSENRTGTVQVNENTTFNFTLAITKRELTYNSGLWKHCACLTLSVFKTTICHCMENQMEKAWFVATQVTAVLALVGLITACILSVAAILSSRSEKIKLANIITTIASGLLIIVAVGIYGTEANAHIDQVFDAYLVKSVFGYSFILCCIAACICLLIVVPLFVIDSRLAVKQISLDTSTVQYSQHE